MHVHFCEKKKKMRLDLGGRELEEGKEEEEQYYTLDSEVLFIPHTV